MASAWGWWGRSRGWNPATLSAIGAFGISMPPPWLLARGSQISPWRAPSRLPPRETPTAGCHRDRCEWTRRPSASPSDLCAWRWVSRSALSGQPLYHDSFSAKRTKRSSFSRPYFSPSAGELRVPEVSEPQWLRADPTKIAPTMVRHAVISLFMFAAAGAAAEPGVARARASNPTLVGVRSSHEETSTSLASSRVTTAQPFGLVPCDKPPAPPGCFILRTPFPPKGVRGAEACELRSPGLTVTLSGGSSSDPVNIPILYSHFDGVDVMFDVDIRAALVAEGVRAGDSRTLRASASLACPTDTFEDAAEELPTNRCCARAAAREGSSFHLTFSC